MSKVFAKTIEGAMNGLVSWVIAPVTGVIPFLASSGILLAIYAVLWLAFGGALVADQQALADAWASIGALPLPLIGLAWLLFLPPMAGLWVWASGWPLVVRLVLIAGLAGFNVLVMLPRRERPSEGADKPAQA